MMEFPWSLAHSRGRPSAKISEWAPAACAKGESCGNREDYAFVKSGVEAKG